MGVKKNQKASAPQERFWKQIGGQSDGGEVFTFDDPGEQLICKVNSLGSGKTKFGQMGLIRVTAEENGEDYAVFLSAGLANIDWSELIGQTVRIVYMGMETNEKTGREYKSFEVYAVASEDEIPF